MIEITLQEYDTWPSTESEKNEAKSLSSRLTNSDKKLADLLVEKKILNFQRLEEKGLLIKAQNFIGTVNFSEFKIRIIPKIYKKDEPGIWKNITTCIHFAHGYSSAKILEYQKIPFEDEDIILPDYLIWALTFECDTLLKKGLLKSYVVRDDNLHYLRGKLILKNQFLNDVQKKVQFFCEYDELEYDNIENRIILYTLILSERIAMSSELKKNIFRLIQQFSGLVQKVPISVLDIKRTMKSYTRQNIHYEDSHTICKLLLENTGISDFYHKDTPFSIPFFVNMNTIFEEFVTRLFDTYHSDDVTPQSVQKAWEIDDDSGKTMRPDIILRNNIEHSLTIIDIKYKEKLDLSDLYQIGFYIHEYRDKYLTQHDHEAFAILPQYPDDSTKSHDFKAIKSGIKIHEKHLIVNDFVKLIKEDNSDILKTEISKLLVAESEL